MKLLYFYDALCGWCYGFSPTIQKFVSAHINDFDVEVISGGMVVGDRVGPIATMAPIIESSYKTIEDRTGVRFGDKFLNETLKDGTTIFSSVPPAIALSAFKTLVPEKQLAYASGLQKLIYYEGVSPQSTDELIQLAVILGADQKEMEAALANPQVQSATQDEFRYANQLGITGYPTAAIEQDGKLYALARGAVDYNTLDENYKAVLVNR